MKKILLSLAIVATMIGSVSAQTYKADYTTKVTLAGSMTDPINTVTIKAPVLSAPWSLSLPVAAATTNGYVLTGNTNGTTQWVNIFGGSLAGAFSTLSSTDNSSIGTSTSAVLNSFGTGGNALSVMNTIGSTGAGSMTTINGSITLGAMSTGILHTDNTGVVTSSKIVDGDITAGTISNASLANSAITVASPNGTLTVPGAATSLGGTANVDIDLTHSNTWTGKQTINGAGKFVYTGNGEAAGYVLTSDINGVATWASLSGIGVTSIVGTSPINVSTTAGVATVSITHGDLTSSTSDLTVTGGTGAVIGSGTSISLTTGALTGNGALSFSGGGTVVGSATSVSLATDASLKVASNQLQLDLTHGNTWSGQQDFGAVTYTSASPAAITAATNDWALSASISYFKISSTGNQTVSGITGGVDGRVIVLVNTGSGYINFTNADVNSAAANEFMLQGGDNVLLGPNGNISFVYDGTAAMWRMLYAN